MTLVACLIVISGSISSVVTRSGVPRRKPKNSRMAPGADVPVQRRTQSSGKPNNTLCLGLHSIRRILSLSLLMPQSNGMNGIAGHISVYHHDYSPHLCECSIAHVIDNSITSNTAPDRKLVKHCRIVHVQTLTMCVHCRVAISAAVKQLMQHANDDGVAKSVLPAAQWVRAAHLLKMAVESVDDEQPSMYTCKENKVTKTLPFSSDWLFKSHTLRRTTDKLGAHALKAFKCDITCHKSFQIARLSYMRGSSYRDVSRSALNPEGWLAGC